MSDPSKFKQDIDALGKALTAVGELEKAGQGFVIRSMVDRLGLNSRQSHLNSRQN